MKINMEDVNKDHEDTRGLQNKEKEGITILQGDFREIGKQIPDNSIHAIITDPVYSGQYLHLWDNLAELAERVLKPSGFLITYSGQLYLDKVIEKLSKKLQYYWTISLLHSGGNQLVFARNMLCGWKPILIYQKAPLRKIEEQSADVVNGSGREKDLHRWQQAEGELISLINAFTKEGDTVLDPMAGSGTTLSACYKLKRNIIGIDIVEENIAIIKGRISKN